MREFAGDTWALLVEWGKWSRDGRPSLYGDSPLLRMMGGERGGSAPLIQDDSALEVDRVVGNLKRRDYRMYFVIELSFIRGWSRRDIAAELGISCPSVDKLTAGAVGWIDYGLQRFSGAA